MVYRWLFDVHTTVWHTDGCLMYRPVCGVQMAVWCTEGCLMYKMLFDVQTAVWCTDGCVVLSGCSHFAVSCFCGISVVACHVVNVHAAMWSMFTLPCGQCSHCHVVNVYTAMWSVFTLGDDSHLQSVTNSGCIDNQHFIVHCHRDSMFVIVDPLLCAWWSLLTSIVLVTRGIPPVVTCRLCAV